MKPILIALAALAGAGSLQAVTVYQTPDADYVKFTAGSYSSLVNSATSVITDNGDGTLTTATRDDSAAATLTYSIDFLTTGNYTLYIEVTSPNGLNSDSIFTGTSFDFTPLATNDYNWNNLGTGTGHNWLALTSGSTGSNVFKGAYPAYDTFLVSDEGLVELIFRPREAGLIWENFVLSTNAGLSLEQLDGLAYSALTPVPEPSTYATLAGIFVMGAAWYRRRYRSAR